MLPRSHLIHLKAPAVQQHEDQCITLEENRPCMHSGDELGGRAGWDSRHLTCHTRAAYCVKKPGDKARNKNGEEKMKQIRCQQLHCNCWGHSHTALGWGKGAARSEITYPFLLQSRTPRSKLWCCALGSDFKQTGTGCSTESSSWFEEGSASSLHPGHMPPRKRQCWVTLSWGRLRALNFKQSSFRPASLTWASDMEVTSAFLQASVPQSTSGHKREDLMSIWPPLQRQL